MLLVCIVSNRRKTFHSLDGMIDTGCIDSEMACDLSTTAPDLFPAPMSFYCARLHTFRTCFHSSTPVRSHRKAEVKKKLDCFIHYMQCHGYYAAGYSSFGTNVVDEIAQVTTAPIGA